MTTKARIEKKYGREKDVVVYETETFDVAGRLAAVLVERWGLVAAKFDGEDSAGRAKMALPSVREVVERAFDMAEGFMSEAKRRGHLVEIPDLNEVNAENDEKERLVEAARRA